MAEALRLILATQIDSTEVYITLNSITDQFYMYLDYN